MQSSFNDLKLNVYKTYSRSSIQEHTNSEYSLKLSQQYPKKREYFNIITLREKKLKKILRTSSIRIHYLQHNFFKKFKDNLLRNQTHKKIRFSESKIENFQKYKIRSDKKEEKLNKIAKVANLRYFVFKLLRFRKWCNFKSEIRISTEEDHCIVKSRRTLSGKNLANLFPKCLLDRQVSAINNKDQEKTNKICTQESIRKNALLKKHLMSLIFKNSISYETAIWRWKYSITYNYQELYPSHTILYRRMNLIASNYLNRLKQFALFKIVMFSTMTPYHHKQNSSSSFQSAINILLKRNREHEDSISSQDKCSFLSIGEKSINDSFIIASTNASSKLSKEDVLIVSQSGAVEIINVVLKTAKSRRMEWVMTLLYVFTQRLSGFDEERESFIEEIDLLRYDKHCLLEDNTSLRIHNEALIDHLEQTNANCYNLSLMINDMKIMRMISILSRLTELPMLDGLLSLKFNRENFYRY